MSITGRRTGAIFAGAAVAPLGATWCHLAPVGANRLHKGACWSLMVPKGAWRYLTLQRKGFLRQPTMQYCVALCSCFRRVLEFCSFTSEDSGMDRRS